MSLRPNLCLHENQDNYKAKLRLKYWTNKSQAREWSIFPAQKKKKFRCSNNPLYGNVRDCYEWYSWEFKHISVLNWANKAGVMTLNNETCTKRSYNTRKLSIRNLPSTRHIKLIIRDLEIPSLFSTEISHSIPVPRSTTFRTGTLAPRIGCTPNTFPFPRTSESYSYCICKHKQRQCLSKLYFSIKIEL